MIDKNASLVAELEAAAESFTWAISPKDADMLRRAAAALAERSRDQERLERIVAIKEKWRREIAGWNDPRLVEGFGTAAHNIRLLLHELEAALTEPAPPQDRCERCGFPCMCCHAGVLLMSSRCCLHGEYECCAPPQEGPVTVREGGHVVIHGYRPLAENFVPSDKSGYAFEQEEKCPLGGGCERLVLTAPPQEPCQCGWCNDCLHVELSPPTRRERRQGRGDCNKWDGYRCGTKALVAELEAAAESFTWAISPKDADMLRRAAAALAERSRDTERLQRLEQHAERLNWLESKMQEADCSIWKDLGLDWRLAGLNEAIDAARNQERA